MHNFLVESSILSNTIGKYTNGNLSIIYKNDHIELQFNVDNNILVVDKIYDLLDIRQFQTFTLGNYEFQRLCKYISNYEGIVGFIVEPTENGTSVQVFISHTKLIVTFYSNTNDRTIIPQFNPNFKQTGLKNFLFCLEFLGSNVWVNHTQEGTVFNNDSCEIDCSDLVLGTHTYKLEHSIILELTNILKNYKNKHIDIHIAQEDPIIIKQNQTYIYCATS